MELLLVSLSIAMLLLVWFKTSAFEEYVHVLNSRKLKVLFKLDEYELLVNEPGAEFISYHDFLKNYYDCWLVRLITCPICTSYWLGFFAYFWCPWCLATAFLGLLFYYTVCKLL